MTKLPKFSHEDKAINNFVNIILSNPDIDDRNEMILAFGAVLGNDKLVNYVSEIDPTIINEPISNRVIGITNQICGPFFGIYPQDDAIVVNNVNNNNNSPLKQ